MDGNGATPPRARCLRYFVAHRPLKRYLLCSAATAMSLAPESKVSHEPKDHQCLARSVAQALAEDPSLEAVTIDRDRKTISVATLGKTNAPKITDKISTTFEQAQSAQTHSGCN